jgi:hypothetical protein
VKDLDHCGVPEDALEGLSEGGAALHAEDIHHVALVAGRQLQQGYY